MKYAGEGGSVVSMPRTSGFSSFKNPLRIKCDERFRSI